MHLRLCSCLLIAAALLSAAGDPAAARIAQEADKARKSGQYVRAYQLYTEAANRDKSNPSYAANRDAMEPFAKLLAKAGVEFTPNPGEVDAIVKHAEADGRRGEPPVELARVADWNEDRLASIPKLRPLGAPASFNLRGDERTLFQQVASTYGITATFDPQLEPKTDLRFAIDQADFKTAMEALADVTGTFVFPISPQHVFVARDTEIKRQELEPEILLTFPLPNALEQKDVIDAANAVRSVLGSRAIGWDSVARIVMVRDRASRARVAYGLLEAILLPKAQVSFQVQVLTLDQEKNYHYGLALPTAFQLVDIIRIPQIQTVLPSLASSANLVFLGGGATLLGIGLGNANFFATYTNSFSTSLFDATVVVSDGQTANFHVGDQYPIPQALYTGPATGLNALGSAVGQITFVDLGLILKLTPKVNGAGEIAINIDAAFKALGSQTFNTVPAVLQREFKGSVMVREGEVAVIAGLDSETFSKTRNGLIGLADTPGLNQALSENTRDTQTSQTLLIVKPTITRLPMSNTISPQYLLGPTRGQRVLM